MTNFLEFFQISSSFLQPGIVLTTLQSPISAISLPLLHYILLQLTSPLLATIPIGLFIYFIPLIKNDPLIHPATCCLFIGAMFKTFDAALLDPKIINSLTFMQYVKYLTVYILPRKFATKLTKENKLSPMESASIKYDKLFSISFYVKFAVEVILKSVYAYLILIHLNTNRPSWNPKLYGILNPTDLSLENLSLFRDHFLICFALMFGLEMLGNLFNLATALIFKADYAPMMNTPYFATSVRDFWVRWNLLVQRGLRRIIFDPVLSLSGYDGTSKKVPSGVMVIAAMSTFAFSGLFHQWIIYCLSPNPSWEQMAFFMIQGVIGMIEIVVLKVIKTHTGIYLGKVVPKPVAIAYTLFVLVITGPLFNAPWVRDGIFQRIFDADLSYIYAPLHGVMN